MTDTAGALPNLVIIGAMKAGTSALHHYLDLHPEIAMSEPKELNFFFEPPAGERGEVAPRGVRGVNGSWPWSPGNWHRRLDWYARHFPARSAVRGESSPGYTSPGREVVAERMAAVIPDARLIYLVRDPVERALSQYRHHLRDRTEHRSPEEALLDPCSHYVARSCYWERLEPFLRVFPSDQIAIVSTEELSARRQATLRWIFEFLGVDGSFWTPAIDRRSGDGRNEALHVDGSVRRRLEAALADDAARLRKHVKRTFPEWSI